MVRPSRMPTGRTYTIASVTETNAGQYRFKAFNSVMEVESEAATLTVAPPPAIDLTAANGHVRVTFTGTLQSAARVTDVFTDVTPQAG